MSLRWIAGRRRRDRLRIELAADMIDEAEAEEQSDFMDGYVMGACVMAAVLGVPPDVWAYPERAERRRAAGR